MAKPKNSEQLTTVKKAISVVELIASDGPLTLTQVSQRLGIGTTACHRLVSTLAFENWLVKAPDNTYRVGSKLLGILASMHESVNAAELVRPILSDLWERTQETIHLTQLEGRSIVYLDQLVSPRPVHSVSAIGGRSPAHCVSPGLSQIAAQRDQGYLDWFLSRPLTQYTQNTTTDAREFRSLISSIREAGYAVNLGGFREDVGGVGVAVNRPDGQPIFGLSVCAPVYRLLSSDTYEIGNILIDASQRMADLLTNRNATYFA